MNDWLQGDAGEALRFLSLLLAPPGRPLARLLRGEPGFPGGGDWPRRYPDEGALLRALQEEHTRLFVSAFPGLAASPYASDHLGQVQGPLLAELEGRLASLGLAVTAAGEGRPDHLRMLLEAAAHMTADGERGAFLRRFLGPWLSDYRKRLGSAARLPFFPAVIAAVESLIRSETDGVRHGHRAVAT